MARIYDSDGNLLGGIDRLLAGLPGWKRAAAQVSDESPAALSSIPPPFGPNEDVRWLTCSYGNLKYVVYSSGERKAASSDSEPDSRREGCRNQVDKPRKRHYCPACGGNYCASHADPSAHDCASVLRLP